MSAPNTQNSEAAYRHDLIGYQTGFGLALILTVIPFVLVAAHVLSTVSALWIVGILGAIQVVVHLRYFLHVDLSHERREELYLIMFSASLVAVMVAGMLWILFNLHSRMM